MNAKLIALAAAFVIVPAAGQAQQARSAPAAARPATATAPAQAAPTRAYEVKGFRSARFGMDEAAVVAAAAKDFGVADKDVQRQVNPAEGTRALVVQVPALEPGPGPATVQYILGAGAGRLIHVNVIWTAPETAGAEARDKLITAGLQLTRYYRSFAWGTDKAVADVPAGPNAVIAFAGQDAAGGLVEARLDGVAFSRPVNGQVVKSPTPTGPARLRVAYSQSPKNPDVAKIENGAF